MRADCDHRGGSNGDVQLRKIELLGRVVSVGAAVAGVEFWTAPERWKFFFTGVGDVLQETSTPATVDSWANGVGWSLRRDGIRILCEEVDAGAKL